MATVRYEIKFFFGGFQQILTWGTDRVDIANSMEARPSFLDHHLAEYATHRPILIRKNGRR